MKPFFLFSYLFTGCLLVLSFHSCIRDNLSDCDPTGVTAEPRAFNLYFSYTPLSYAARGFDPAEIEEIHLFIFDEEGRYVGMEIDSSPQLNADYYIPVNLVPGIYDFIVWSNVTDCYSYTLAPEELEEAENPRNDIQLCFATGSDGRVTEPPHPLFFGNLEKTKILEKDNQRFTMPLVKNTYTIHVTATGLDETDDLYELAIQDRGNSYKFDNTYASSTEVTYITNCRKDPSGQPYGSLTVQRLMEDRRYGQLKLTNATQNETLYDDNLVELLLLLRQVGVSVDFSRTYEYDVVLDFKPVPTPGSRSHVLVSIRINGWVVVQNDYNVK